MPSYTAYQNYQIATGHNNVAGLVNVEQLVDGEGNRFPTLYSLGSYARGMPVQRADGSVTFDGLGGLGWVFDELLPSQYEYLLTTYCGGGLSGLVTIKTRTVGLSYANFNATLLLPPMSEFSVEAETYLKVTLKFTRLAAL